MKNPKTSFFRQSLTEFAGSSHLATAASESHGVAQPFIFFHRVQLPPACAGPDTAAPAAWFAPPGRFARFHGEKRVGGRGISDFPAEIFPHPFLTPRFFLSTPSRTQGFECSGGFVIPLRAPYDGYDI